MNPSATLSQFRFKLLDAQLSSPLSLAFFQEGRQFAAAGGAWLPWLGVLARKLFLNRSDNESTPPLTRGRNASEDSRRNFNTYSDRSLSHTSW
jgi:hypothetical protein